MGAKKLLTVAELAQRWNMSVRWVYEHARLGNIPRAPIPGRLLRFDPEVIDALTIPGSVSSFRSVTTQEKGKKLGRKLRGEELWSS